MNYKERLELRAKRLAVCQKCPIFDKKLLRCGPKKKGGCGCFIMAKGLLPNQKCPQGKW